MATAVHTHHSLAGAEAFEVNGFRPLGSLDSSVLFEQSHAMLSFINAAIVEDVEEAVGPANPVLLRSALLGAQTLLSLGILAQDNERLQIVRS